MHIKVSGLDSQISILEFLCTNNSFLHLLIAVLDSSSVNIRNKFIDFNFPFCRFTFCGDDTAYS